MTAPPTHPLFVGSYGPADAATIHACSFDAARGELRMGASTSGITNPSFLVVSPDGAHLYAVSETGVVSDGSPGAVHAFRIAQEAGAVALNPVNERASGGDHPCHLTIHADGRWLVVSNYGTGSVVVLPIHADGSLGDVTSHLQHDGRGPHPERQEGPHAHAAIFTPDGRFVIAADLGIDRLLVSAFDPDAGTLRPHGEVATRPGAGPRHLAFHPSGSHLLVVNELDNTVTLYDWDGTGGRLREVSTLPTLEPGAPENLAADIRVAPDGRHLYVSNRGDDSIAVFAFERHRLMRLAVRPCGGAWPRGLSLTPGASHLLAANQHTGEVSVLPVLADGADVGGPVARARIPRPTCVALA